MTKKLLIKQEDLYTFSVRNSTDEQRALQQIISQTAYWLRENNLEQEVRRNKYNSILMNKLVYYSMRKLQVKNPRLKLRSGWYKYGPCCEELRHGEESLGKTMFSQWEITGIDDVLPEIEETCRKLVPVFMKSVRKGGFPHSYLHYVYKRSSDISEDMKRYYLAKSALSEALDRYSRGDKRDASPLERYLIEFDAAVMNPKYYRQIELSESEIRMVTEYTALIPYVIESSTQSTVHKQMVRDVVMYFLNGVLMIFAYRNYMKTFESYNPRNRKRVMEFMRDKSDEFIKNLEIHLDSYYDRLNMVLVGV